MKERTNGLGEIVTILALCAVVMVGIVALITHMNPPSVANAEASAKSVGTASSAN